MHRLFVSVRRALAEPRTPAQFPKVAGLRLLPQTTRNGIGHRERSRHRATEGTALYTYSHVPRAVWKALNRFVVKNLGCIGVSRAYTGRKYGVGPPSDNEGI
jgi:hypothetical protein